MRRVDNVLELVVAGGLLDGPELGLVPHPVQVLLRHERVQLGLQGAEVHGGGGRGRRTLLLRHLSLLVSCSGNYVRGGDIDQTGTLRTTVAEMKAALFLWQAASTGVSKEIICNLSNIFAQLCTYNRRANGTKYGQLFVLRGFIIFLYHIVILTS